MGLCNALRIVAATLAIAAGAVAAGAGLAAAPTPPVVQAPPQAVPAWRSARQVAVITIKGVMDDVTRASVLRRIRQSIAEGANGVVLELDTPGGDLSATLELCLAVKELVRVPVYAWVHPRAYSAGTILALACDGILVSPNAAFGDAAPIQALPGMGLMPLPVAERAKIEAPVLAEVIDSARRTGYDEALVRAFVTAQQEVWMLKNRETGKRVFVDRAEYRTLFGSEPPESRTGGPLATRAPIEGTYTVEPAYDDRFRKPEAGDSANPSAADVAEREKYINFMQIRPPSRAQLTAADAPQWELVAQVDAKDELLVLYSQEARAFGLAVDTASNDSDVAGFFGALSVVRYDEHWGDAVVRFLTSWPVRLFLVVILLAGFIVEIAAPGVGWFGGAAAVALILLMGAPMLAGIQSWWPVALLLVGLTMVILEVFVLPGFGIVGLMGIGCIAAGLVASFVQAPLSTPEGQSDLTSALVIVVGGGVLSIAAAWIALRALPRTKLARAAVLNATTSEISAVRATPRRVLRAGQVGTTVTPLRPVGKADFDGALVEVQSVGSYIDQGKPVVVVRSDEYVVEVEEQAS